MRPAGVPGDRAPRRSEADWSDAADALDHIDAPGDVAPELVRRLLVDPTVLVPVTAELVPSRDYVGERFRVSLRRHAGNEERRADVEEVEEVEEGRDVLRERVASGLPVGTPDLVVRELMPVLEVERQ